MTHPSTKLSLKEQLLLVSEAFCAGRGISLARASTIVFNDGKKLGAIASNGADLATGKYEAAMRWFSANWPENAIWPEGVARPDVVADASAGGGGQ